MRKMKLSKPEIADWKAEELPISPPTGTARRAWHEVTIDVLGLAGVATDHTGCSLSFDSLVQTAPRRSTANASPSTCGPHRPPQMKAVVSVLRDNQKSASTELSNPIIRSAINDILIPTEGSGPAAEKVAHPQRGGILHLLGLHRFVALWDGNNNNNNNNSACNLHGKQQRAGSSVTFDSNLTISHAGTATSETIQLVVALVDANSGDSMLSATLVGTCSFVIGEQVGQNGITLDLPIRYVDPSNRADYPVLLVPNSKPLFATKKSTKRPIRFPFTRKLICKSLKDEESALAETGSEKLDAAPTSREPTPLLQHLQSVPLENGVVRLSVQWKVKQFNFEVLLNDSESGVTKPILSTLIPRPSEERTTTSTILEAVENDSTMALDSQSSNMLRLNDLKPLSETTASELYAKRHSKMNLPGNCDPDDAFPHCEEMIRWTTPPDNGGILTCQDNRDQSFSTLSSSLRSGCSSMSTNDETLVDDLQTSGPLLTDDKRHSFSLLRTAMMLPIACIAPDTMDKAIVHDSQTSQPLEDNKGHSLIGRSILACISGANTGESVIQPDSPPEQKFWNAMDSASTTSGSSMLSTQPETLQTRAPVARPRSEMSEQGLPTDEQLFASPPSMLSTRGDTAPFPLEQPYSIVAEASHFQKLDEDRIQVAANHEKLILISTARSAARSAARAQRRRSLQSKNYAKPVETALKASKVPTTPKITPLRKPPISIGRKCTNCQVRTVPITFPAEGQLLIKEPGTVNNSLATQSSVGRWNETPSKSTNMLFLKPMEKYFNQNATPGTSVPKLKSTGFDFNQLTHELATTMRLQSEGKGGDDAHSNEATGYAVDSSLEALLPHKDKTPRLLFPTDTLETGSSVNKKMIRRKKTALLKFLTRDSGSPVSHDFSFSTFSYSHTTGTSSSSSSLLSSPPSHRSSVKHKLQRPAGNVATGYGGRGSSGEFVRHLSSFSKLRETMQCLPKWDTTSSTAKSEDKDLLSTQDELGLSLNSWSFSTMYGHEEDESSAAIVGGDEMSTTRRRYARKIRGLFSDDSTSIPYPTSLLGMDQSFCRSTSTGFGNSSNEEMNFHAPQQAQVVPVMTTTLKAKDDLDVKWWNDDGKGDTTATESESSHHSDDFFRNNITEEEVTPTMIVC
jgi:hypothetical protein